MVMPILSACAFQNPISNQELASTNSNLHEQIATIIATTVHEGQGVTREGQRFYTFVPPSPDALETVKRNADDAIPILNEFIWGKDPNAGHVAMRLLGALGGEKILAQLTPVIDKHPSPGMRSLALRWVSTAPWERALPILKRAAAKDSSRSVRDTAKELIARHAQQE